MIAEIESFPFFVRVAAQGYQPAGQRKAGCRADSRPADCEKHCANLPDKLGAERIGLAAMAAQCGKGSERGPDRSDNSAEAVDSKHVETVVQPQTMLGQCDEAVAGRAGSNAEAY